MTNINIKNNEISEELANSLFEKANTEGLWLSGDGYRTGHQEEVKVGSYAELKDVIYAEWYCDFETEVGEVRITVAFDDEAMSAYDSERDGNDFSMLDWENPSVIEAKIVG